MLPSGWVEREGLVYISILIRPEGRMLLCVTLGATADSNVFQSSSAPRDGCYPGFSGQRSISICHFNPHPPRGTDATSTTALEIEPDGIFQSSSAPRDGCYPVKKVPHSWFADISILIRPEGRMLPSVPIRVPWALCISILIRPEGRMLPASTLSRHRLSHFNPHPPRGTDATRFTVSVSVPNEFQSSSAPRDGCYRKRRRITVTNTVPFQSSSAPRDGCYSVRTALRISFTVLFQSSSAPRDGCYFSHFIMM